MIVMFDMFGMFMFHFVQFLVRVYQRLGPLNLERHYDVLLLYLCYVRLVLCSVIVSCFVFLFVVFVHLLLFFFTSVLLLCVARDLPFLFRQLLR